MYRALVYMREKRNYCKNLKAHLATGWIAQTIHYYAETDSTNLQAKLAADKGAGEGTLFVADKQTAGRGRRGRNWESPAGTNIYFTLLLRPEFAPDMASQVTLVMGMAVAEAIREYCGLDARIKWPNDVVIGGKKVCGILTELGLQGSSIDHLIVGVGINVGRQEFPPEIAATATSLAEEKNCKIDRTELLTCVMDQFEVLYEEFVQKEGLHSLRKQYDMLLINRDREVRVLDPKGEYTGVARGITDAGELIVELSDGTVNYVYAGEVSVRGVYGYV